MVGVVGLGLVVLWVIGRTEDATAWLLWFEGSVALGVVAVVGLVPARRSGRLAGACLLGLTLALFALWLIAVLDDGTPWFAWWTFTFAWLCLGTAGLVTFQGPIDATRAPDEI